MSQDNLGLFDTPPSREQIRSSIAIVGLLLVVLVLVLMVRDIPLGQIDAFIPMIDATTTLVDLIIATLLYAQATVFRSRSLCALATGYVFTGLMLIPHALTFPGAFAPGGLLGAGVSSTAWIYIFWRTGLPVAVIAYVLFNRADALVSPEHERPPVRIALAVALPVTLVAAATILATAGHDLLPALYLTRAVSNYPHMIRVASVVIVLALVAMAMLFRRRQSVLDVWLLVVLSAWLLQTLLFLALGSRFTVAWYFTVVVVLLSHLFLMLALIAESSRLYARLAISTAARNREREARLMSMDAMAVAISHEVGQPLSAVITNATGGLNWLAREELDREKIAEALLATIDAGKRATDVIKSIRGVFARKPGMVSEFDLNALVRETRSLLERELADDKVSLELALDEALPPVLADRVQIQQVLINLVINAIESLRETQGRQRRIEIRSALLNDHDALLEISDTGLGIALAEMDQIFQAFFTTKATGTGLGLSLCRTIVEEHGGSLWASSGEEHGATFHLLLPRSGLDTF